MAGRFTSFEQEVVRAAVGSSDYLVVMTFFDNGED